jgi:hypothetical protein
MPKLPSTSHERYHNGEPLGTIAPTQVPVDAQNPNSLHVKNTQLFQRENKTYLPPQGWPSTAEPAVCLPPIRDCPQDHGRKQYGDTPHYERDPRSSSLYSPYCPTRNYRTPTSDSLPMRWQSKQPAGYRPEVQYVSEGPLPALSNGTGERGWLHVIGAPDNSYSSARLEGSEPVRGESGV